MTSWQDRLRYALAAHALIEAGDQARGTVSSSAAMRAVRAVQDAIAQAEADGATEAELDEIIAGHTHNPRPAEGQRTSTWRCTMTDHEQDQPDPTDPTEQPDRPLTEQDVARVVREQHDREERPRPMTDQEREERVERDADAVLIFGPEAWPADPPDPDES